MVPTDTADDIVAEIFLRAWRSGKWKEDTTEGTDSWLSEITESVLEAQKLSSEHQNALLGRLQGRLLQSDVADDILNTLELREQLQAAACALERLPPAEREPVALWVSEGMPYAEMAAKLDLPINTLRSRLSRGRKRLLQLTLQESVRAEWRRKQERATMPNLTRTRMVEGGRPRRRTAGTGQTSRDSSKSDHDEELRFQAG